MWALIVRLRVVIIEDGGVDKLFAGLLLRGTARMGATIEALHNLQEIEIQIADIQRGIDRKKRVCQKREQTIADLEKKIEKLDRDKHLKQKEADRLQLDVRSHDDHITKLRESLNTAKNQKEYSSVLTELNTFKADNSKTEEQILVYLGEIDELNKEIGDIQSEVEAERSKLTENEQAVNDAEDKASNRLNKLRTERDAAAEGIPPELIDMFTRVASKNDGEAMAMIMRTHPRRQEYACEGCNMAITIEQVNNVLSRDEAVLCNVCGRILYAETAAAS